MMLSTKTELCLLTFLYYVLSKCNGEGYRPAPNCYILDCPEYSVIHSQKEFEIRGYKDAQWLSGPTLSSKSYKNAAFKGFNILSDYFHGKNNATLQLKMTAPVLVDVQNSTYTVYFYVPKQYQNSTTLPPSDEVKVVTLPKHKYAAVRRFGGFIRNDGSPAEIAELKKSLKGTPYERAAGLDTYTVAGYDSPFRLIFRVNEVFLWFD